MLQVSSGGMDVVVGTATVSRDQLLHHLASLSGAADLHSSLHALTNYVGASHYLLARCDVLQENGLDFVLSSDWPFYLIKRLAAESVATYARTTEVEKCLQLFQSGFSLLPDDLILPDGISQQYCALTFNVGRTRLSLMLLFREGFILSSDRLRDTGLLAGYCVSLCHTADGRSERDFELTDRELECLFWIAEGKTSDEIAVILGISRNTINNYITSVMRKTATKTRSEAIAFAVRNNLV